MLKLKILLSEVSNLLKNIFFPKFCLSCGGWGKYVCDNCNKKLRPISVDICPYCAKRSLDGFTHPLCGAIEVRLDGLKSLYYFSPPLPKILSSLKYRFTTEIKNELSDMITPTMIKSIIRYATKDTILVPIPLHFLRENHRGFNQAGIVAKLISEKSGLVVENNLLKRIKNTPPQVMTKNREKRLVNLLGAFAVNEKLIDLLKSKSIVLVDDVWTSGATMKEAARVLKKAGASRVLALTFAH